MIDITTAIQEASTYLNHITGGNDLIAGGITVWALGTASYLAKDIPKKFARFITVSFSTSMTFNNAGWSQETMFKNFTEWAEDKLIYSRTAAMATSQEYETSSLGAGYGTHYLRYKNKLIKMDKSTLESSGSERQKEQITLTVLGRSKDIFKSIIKEIEPKASNEDKLKVSNFHPIHGWDEFSFVPKRSLDSIALDKNIKSKLIEEITYFRESKDWYTKAGLAHKLAYIFHGVPGTGKTSLIKALASHFNMNICTANLAGLSDTSIRKVVTSVPANCFLVFEDFDSSSATEVRKEGKKKAAKLTTSGILNAFDGIVPLDNVVMVLTTNHLDHIDPAIYRKGRIDFVQEIPKADACSVRLWAALVFPGIDVEKINKDVLGCQLNEALLISRGDPDVFLEELNKEQMNDFTRTSIYNSK